MIDDTCEEGKPSGGPIDTLWNLPDTEESVGE
jgi:hypothetical protein